MAAPLESPMSKDFPGMQQLLNHRMAAPFLGQVVVYKTGDHYYGNSLFKDCSFACVLSDDVGLHAHKTHKVSVLLRFVRSSEAFGPSYHLWDGVLEEHPLSMRIAERLEANYILGETLLGRARIEYGCAFSAQIKEIFNKNLLPEGKWLVQGEGYAEDARDTVLLAKLILSSGCPSMKEFQQSRTMHIVPRDSGLDSQLSRIFQTLGIVEAVPALGKRDEQSELPYDDRTARILLSQIAESLAQNPKIGQHMDLLEPLKALIRLSRCGSVRMFQVWLTENFQPMDIDYLDISMALDAVMKELRAERLDPQEALTKATTEPPKRSQQSSTLQAGSGIAALLPQRMPTSAPKVTPEQLTALIRSSGCTTPGAFHDWLPKGAPDLVDRLTYSEVSTAFYNMKH